MNLRSSVGKPVRRLLRNFDLAVVRASRVDDLPDPPRDPDLEPPPLPDRAQDILRPDHPDLLALRQAYAGLADHPARVASLWQEDFTARIDLTRFRSNNAYLWQQSETPLRHLLWIMHGYYVATHDRLGLVDSLTEDGLFGAYRFRYMENRIGSKDLLDSINEINFLERTIGLSGRSRIRLLDIGAGYGRLAHRLSGAFPGKVSACLMDAVPESTFLSRYYTQFRGLGADVQVVALHEHERALAAAPFDLVTNVHSFSECSLAAIRWWLALVARSQARHLFIVPNAYHNGGTQLLSREPDGRFLDFRPSIEEHGFRLVAQEPKYRDRSLLPFRVNTHYYLFERQGH